MRLIDADDLKRKICGANCGCVDEECASEHECEFACFIFRQPIIDAVPVVRCKDCKWFEKGKSYTPYCNNAKNLFEEMQADDYCSYGERREVE